MKKKTSVRQRLKYWFDNLMSKGTLSLLLILAVITAVVVLIGGSFSIMLGGADGSGSHSTGFSYWFTLMHAISTGVLTKEEGTFAYLAVMTVVTLVGMFITSFLIGTISNGIKDKMTDLQRGRSLVIEENHTVVIGFDENITNILEELAEANANQSDAVVVVMAEEDKVVMEDVIRRRVPNLDNIRLVCRSGRPDSLQDLRICSLDSCRSIIVNLEDDFMTVKAILACKNLLDESGNRDAYISAIVRNSEVLHPAGIAGGERAEILNYHKTIARLMVQSGRHPGMSSILTELLSFRGQEIYVGENPFSDGLTLRDINLRLSGATAIGTIHDGRPLLEHKPGAVINPDDQLIWIADDDDPLQMQEAADIEESAFGNEPVKQEEAHTLLVLGCSDMLRQILIEENEYAVPGSKVIIAAEPGQLHPDMLPDQSELSNIEIDVRECRIFRRSVLEELVEEGLSGIMLMSDSELGEEEADARTLMLQLQLTDIAEEIGDDLPLIIEMKSAHNQRLSQMMRATDFVVSSSITARMLVQIAEHRHKKAILNDLLSDEGAAVYMKPASRYVRMDQPVDYYTLGASAARYGETAIGYRKFNGDGSITVRLNPQGRVKESFSERDDVIVIAEN